jgi:hypothetical protein
MPLSGDDLNFVGGLTWWLGVSYTYDLAPALSALIKWLSSTSFWSNIL